MKLIALLVCLGLVFAGCSSEQVTETETHYKVEPNVTPLPEGTTFSTPSYTTPAVSTPTYIPPAVSVPTYTTPTASVPPPDAPVVTPSWASETIRETGKCAVDVNFKGSPAQAKVMAERGADLIARRNLIERVAGLRIDSRTTVRDMVTAEDLVNAQSSALLRGARTVDMQFDGSAATATVELSLYEVYQYASVRH